MYINKTNINNNSPNEYYIGDSLISKMYLGATLIYCGFPIYFLLDYGVLDKSKLDSEIIIFNEIKLTGILEYPTEIRWQGGTFSPTSIPTYSLIKTYTYLYNTDKYTDVIINKGATIQFSFQQLCEYASINLKTGVVTVEENTDTTKTRSIPKITVEYNLNGKTTSCRLNNYIIQNSRPVYNVTLSGDNCTLTGAGTYGYGDLCTITCIPDEEYDFDKWSNGSKNTTYIFYVTNDIELSASVIEKVKTLDNAITKINSILGVKYLGKKCDNTPYVWIISCASTSTYDNLLYCIDLNGDIVALGSVNCRPGNLFVVVDDYIFLDEGKSDNYDHHIKVYQRLGSTISLLQTSINAKLLLNYPISNLYSFGFKDSNGEIWVQYGGTKSGSLPAFYNLSDNKLYFNSSSYRAQISGYYYDSDKLYYMEYNPSQTGLAGRGSVMFTDLINYYISDIPLNSIYRHCSFWPIFYFVNSLDDLSYECFVYKPSDSQWEFVNKANYITYTSISGNGNTLVLYFSNGGVLIEKTNTTVKYYTFDSDSINNYLILTKTITL